jgi:hypothetical protein
MRTLGIATLAFILTSAVGAQQPGGAGAGLVASAVYGRQHGTHAEPSAVTPFQDDNGMGQRPIFISGTVVRAMACL